MSMAIASGTNTNYNVKTNTVNSNRNNRAEKTEKESNLASGNNDIVQNEDNDVYETTQNSQAKVSYTPDRTTAGMIKTQTELKYQQMANLVSKMLTDQGKTATMEMGLGDKLAMLEVDQETIAQAKADVGEGGYWSVEKTSERILDFAKAITGGDPSKVEDMRKAIVSGFGAAADVWSSNKKMPQITQDTFDAVMKGLDE